jgi:hypothetical protein
MRRRATEVGCDVTGFDLSTYMPRLRARGWPSLEEVECAARAPAARGQRAQIAVGQTPGRRAAPLRAATSAARSQMRDRHLRFRSSGMRAAA